MPGQPQTLDNGFDNLLDETDNLNKQAQQPKKNTVEQAQQIDGGIPQQWGSNFPKNTKKKQSTSFKKAIQWATTAGETEGETKVKMPYEEKMPDPYEKTPDHLGYYRRACQQGTIEQGMEKVFNTTESMIEVNARIMEMKAAEEGIGEKLGRATARYCDRMMEYFEDEGFTREESMKLLCSMIQNNSIVTGG